MDYPHRLWTARDPPLAPLEPIWSLACTPGKKPRTTGAPPFLGVLRRSQASSSVLPVPKPGPILVRG